MVVLYGPGASPVGLGLTVKLIGVVPEAGDSTIQELPAATVDEMGASADTDKVAATPEEGSVPAVYPSVKLAGEISTAATRTEIVLEVPLTSGEGS